MCFSKWKKVNHSPENTKKTFPTFKAYFFFFCFFYYFNSKNLKIICAVFNFFVVAFKIFFTSSFGNSCFFFPLTCLFLSRWSFPLNSRSFLPVVLQYIQKRSGCRRPRTKRRYWVAPVLDGSAALEAGQKVSVSLRSGVAWKGQWGMNTHTHTVDT